MIVNNTIKTYLKVQKSSSSHVVSFLIVYGLSHALVDASCAFLVLKHIDMIADMWLYIVLYNALAFGLQLPFGLLLDKYKYPKIASIIGLFLVFIAFIYFKIPMLAVVLASIGNAIFHVGGGQVALSINTSKATYPGIFVAPGGIGLALGIYLSFSNVVFNVMIFPIFLLFMILMLFVTKIPNYSVVKKTLRMDNVDMLIVLFLAISIAVRSVIGLSINFPWKTNLNLLILLTISIALGKLLGGIFADRLGWMKTGVFSLLAASLLLAFGASYPVIGIVGILLFNFTMPITLVAISNVLTGRAGLAFGITALALLIGSIPTFTHYKYSASVRN